MCVLSGGCLGEEMEGVSRLDVYFGVKGSMFTETLPLILHGVQNIDGFVSGFE